MREAFVVKSNLYGKAVCYIRRRQSYNLLFFTYLEDETFIRNSLDEGELRKVCWLLREDH